MKKFPDSIVIVCFILIAVVIATWLVPAGEFERNEVNGREQVVPNTYQKVERQGQGFEALLEAPIKGIVSAAHIIAFVFLVGGAFGMLTKTGAIHSSLISLLRFSEKHSTYKKLIIPFIMVLFSLGGATFGMCEEVLVFILITIPLARAMGYDTITGMAIPFLGAGAGFAGAFANPFTVGIAQGIADVPVFSGMNYRIIVWLLFTAVTIVFIMLYVSRLEKGKVKAFNSDTIDSTEKQENEDFTLSRKLIMVLLGIALVLLVVGVNSWGWYIDEISALFLVLGIASAIVSHLTTNDAISAFYNGTKEMMTAALIIGLTKGIMVIATEGKIIDTILNAVAEGASGVPNYIAVQIMFVMQGAINFFVPSGSGQAALTMPIMSPLSDLLGITRQTAVLAFQLGDGLFNMIIPTSGVTMGILAIAKIPYNVWMRWVWKLMVVYILLAMIVLVPPVLNGWG